MSKFYPLTFGEHLRKQTVSTKRDEMNLKIEKTDDEMRTTHWQVDHVCTGGWIVTEVTSNPEESESYDNLGKALQHVIQGRKTVEKKQSRRGK